MTTCRYIRLLIFQQIGLGAAEMDRGWQCHSGKWHYFDLSGCIWLAFCLDRKNQKWNHLPWWSEPVGAMARSFLESIREFPNPEWLGFPSLALTLLCVWMCKKESIKNRSHDLLATWGCVEEQWSFCIVAYWFGASLRERVALSWNTSGHWSLYLSVSHHGPWVTWQQKPSNSSLLTAQHRSWAQIICSSLDTLLR